MDTISASDYRNMMGKKKMKPIANRNTFGYMDIKFRSAWEAKYAMFLDNLKQKGLISAWKYEPLKLNLGVGCTYTPDFMAISYHGDVVLVEVKGYKRESAKVKFRTACTMFPWFMFLMVRLDSDGNFYIIEENVPITCIDTPTTFGSR